jgi:2-polyprenyl-3-methyl-5-hydroxy-6-metoxy-1,4-benzoquinol methylase
VLTLTPSGALQITPMRFALKLPVKHVLTMTQDYLSQTCPICESPAFTPTSYTFDLADTLKRWESELGETFSETVWQEYTLPTSRRVTLHRCNNCRFGMFRPVLAGSPDFYKTITTADGKHLYYIAEKWEFLQAIRALKKYRSHRILDVGCGSGYFLDLLRDRLPSVDYAGYELDSEMVQLARSKGHKVYHGLFPEAVLEENKDKSFDAVCMFQVLEHLPDPVASLKSARRLLSPHGILIIGVPEDSERVRRYFPSALTNIPPHHVSRWCKSTFRVGMPRLGFRVLRVAREPMPLHLWDPYLRGMTESVVQRKIIDKINTHKRKLPIRIVNRAVIEIRGGEDLNALIRKYVRSIIDLLLQILPWSRFWWLRGIPGPHMYVVLQREDGTT